MPFTQMLFGMRSPSSSSSIQWASTGVMSQISSLYNALAPGNMIQLSLLSKGQWEALLPGVGSMQPYCNLSGFNLVPTCCTYTGSAMQVRIGMITNQENECVSPDSFFGCDFL